MNDRIKLLVCTMGGVGLLRKAPGTFGSIKPLILVLVCGHFAVERLWLISLLILMCVGASIATLALAPWYTKYFGQHDPPQVVSDEIAGQSIALLAMAWLIPNEHVSPAIWIGLALLAFVLFRLFDIWKPSIINHAQQLPAGWGVLADDILAGFAAGVLVLIFAIAIAQ